MVQFFMRAVILMLMNQFKISKTFTQLNRKTVQDNLNTIATEYILEQIKCHLKDFTTETLQNFIATKTEELMNIQNFP